LVQQTSSLASTVQNYVKASQVRGRDIGKPSAEKAEVISAVLSKMLSKTKGR